MRVLLVVPRYSYTRAPDASYLFPLGLAYVSAAMKRAGHAVTCLNVNHHAGSTKALVRHALDGEAYDVLCTGHLAAGLEAVRAVLEAARAHPSRPRTVLGGMIVTSAPETVVRFLRPDVGVVGEAEETIVELLDALAHDRELGAIRGLALPGPGGGVTLTPPREPPADLDALPWPDFDGLELQVQLDRSPCNVQPEYLFETDHPRFYPLLASRGCPYRCTFCYHPARHRTRSIGAVLEELEENIPRFDANALFIYDDVLAADPARLEAFCRGLEALQGKLRRRLRWICQLSVRTADAETLRALKDAGCYAVTFGFESMSPEVLRSMGKPITPAEIDRAFRLTMEVGLSLHANFIFGDPAETAETARRTLDYWSATCRGQVVLGFVQPYPGSALYARCRAKGLIPDELAFLRRDVGMGHTGVYLNMTERMSDGEHRALRREVARRHEAHNHFVRPTRLRREVGGRWAATIRCPWCGVEETYRNFAIPSPATFTFWMNCRRCHLRFNLVSAAALVVKRFLPLPLRHAVEDAYNRGVNLRKRLV